MRKIITISCAAGTLALIFIAVILINIVSVKQVCINKNDSYFSDYYVENNKVYIKCSVTLKNNYKEDKTVVLSAGMTDDVNNGLLKDAIVSALNDDGSISHFLIKGKSQQTFDVVFVGDFAGTHIKHDKYLPDIKVDIIN